MVYTDEDVDRPLVEALRARGFDVLTAHEAGTIGQDDDEQLAYAAAIGRVIVSYNRTDFRRWRVRFDRAGRRHHGIVLLPQHSPLARRVVRACMLLDWLTVLGDAAPPLVNWNDLQREIHAGFRLPGYDEHEVLVALGQRDG